MRKGTRFLGIGLGIVLALAGVAWAATDFGAQVQQQMHSRSNRLFGVTKPLEQSSTTSITQQDALANPLHLVTLAGGLSAKVVTAGSAPPNIDQLALWPDATHPKWLIACNEQGDSDPGLFRVSLQTGEWETIVTGTLDCDPVRATPWGTILFGEEAGGGAGGGAMYELGDPVGTTGVTLDRATGTFSGGIGASNLVARYALGRLSFEGLAMYDNGLVYYGDENRPSQGTAGGAYFKFVPSSALSDGTRHIASLEDSPLASGSIYGLRVGLRSGATDYGQGTETGLGSWVQVCTDEACEGVDLRAQAATLHLTGYYRPEDADVDLAAQAVGQVRWCTNNTGNESDDQSWGETICLTDGLQSQALLNTATPEVQRLVLGRPSLAMPDNIEFQPARGNVILHEDADTTYLTPHNNDLWSCLPDGSDDDLQSDGCARVGTLNDLTAEWTGGIFDASGKHFYVSVQHNISGYGTIADITGWK
jgi:secreted PhoX family phosphatase